MGIQDAFCPRCGKLSDGICETCMGEGEPWFRIEPRVTCTSCPTCGALKESGGWVQYHGDREKLIDRLVRSVLHIAPSVRDVVLRTTCEDRSSNRTSCMVSISGTSHGTTHTTVFDLDIAWKGELCLRCSRQSGGYHEGVVQVRALRRPVAEREKDAAIRCAQDVEERLREDGDPLSFISRIDDVHGGIDIVVGTQGLGKMIAQAIIEKTGGTVSTHPKLAGERDGIPLYRITFSVRLPRFQKGDVVEGGGRYGEIRSSDGKRVTVFDLQKGDVKVQSPDPEWRVVANVHEALNVLVAYHDRGVVGVIDPRTGITREIPHVSWIEPTTGSHVRAVADDEKQTLVMVG